MLSIQNVVQSRPLIKEYISNRPDLDRGILKIALAVSENNK